MRGSDPSKGVLKIISAREISHSQRGHQSIDTANNQITNVPESNHQEHQQCQILLILFQPPRTRGSYDEKKKKKAGSLQERMNEQHKRGSFEMFGDHSFCLLPWVTIPVDLISS